MLLTGSWDTYQYDIFYLIVLSVVIFIIGSVLSLKYTKYKKHIGTILIAIGIFDLLPYFVVIIDLLNRGSQVFFLPNPTMFLTILEFITLFGGIAILIQVKRVWILFLIIAVVLQFLWTVVYYFT